MTQVTIRDLIKSDKQNWAILWQAYLEFYKTTRPAQMFDLAFERLISNDQNEFKGLIAEWNNQPVGLAHTLTHRHGWYEEKTIYLQDLFVVPNLQGKGIGRALIEKVYRRADSAGTPKVYWMTAVDNIQAQKLYDSIAQKSGFIQYTRPGSDG